jgi:hypothetical protein
MSDTLLLILIGLMSLTLLTLSWATIALLMQARKELPVLRQRVDELNMRLGRVLEETVPALQTTTQALQEAHRALHEAAETMENLHIVSDNIRHKLEVADEVAGKVRRVPEKAARVLGRLMHYAFKLGGQLLLQRLQGRGDQRVKSLPSSSVASPSELRGASRSLNRQHARSGKGRVKGCRTQVLLQTGQRVPPSWRQTQPQRKEG